MSWVTIIEDHSRGVYSQSGEDGIIEWILANIGVQSKVAVEFGAGDGVALSNTRLLLDQGFSLFMFDVAPRAPHVVQAKINADNINEVFTVNGVPNEIDLLSIDIDGNDYWVWKALTDYRPRVVIVETNVSIPRREPKTIVYDPDFVWDGTDYYGASLAALMKLGDSKGYVLVHEHKFLNAFFVRKELVPDGATYDPFLVEPAYDVGKWPPDQLLRPWVDV